MSEFPWVVIGADGGTLEYCETEADARVVAASESGARVEYQPEPHPLDGGEWTQ